MKSLVDLIPHILIRKIVLFAIDKLRDQAHACCKNGNDWTVCLGPIADAWKKLDDTWDQLLDLFNHGIDVEKFIRGRNNL